MSDQFTSSTDFGVQIIAKGEYEDRPYSDGDIYTVEVTTLRLNPAASSEWQSANAYDSFKTAEEWRRNDDKQQAKLAAFNQKIVCLLSLEDKGSISITQAEAATEVFTVVQIWKVAPAASKGVEGGGAS